MAAFLRSYHEGSPTREVRRPRIDEAQAIIDLHRDTVERVNSQDYTAEQIAVWIGNRRVEITEELIRKNHWWVCVDSDGSLLGLGTLGDNQITGLYVHADHLGEGIGSSILERMEKEIQATDAPDILVESTLTAVGFYRRRGYEEIDRGQVGPAKLDVVNLRKRLHSSPMPSVR